MFQYFNFFFQSGYWGLETGHGCNPCSCDPIGSRDKVCDANSGQCSCKKGVGGLNCDSCLPGYFGFSQNGCSGIAITFNNHPRYFIFVFHSVSVRAVCCENEIFTCQWQWESFPAVEFQLLAWLQQH